MELRLCSESPRRRALLGRAGWRFQCASPQTAAELDGSAALPLEEIPVANALNKARSLKTAYPGELLLGADTVVIAAGRLLGKPRDPVEAAEMLGFLSGRTHEVVTGLALLYPDGREEAWRETTRVTFKTLSPAAVAEYLQKVSVLDKAGAYAIQEHGALLLEKLEGSLENVIGLPLLKLNGRLAAAGVERQTPLKVLVSAGPTREKIDAVRFLSNRSSGKMGYALARQAAARGCDVTLVSGPVALTPPAGVRFIAVESALEMAEAVWRGAKNADVVIMAAAVADYTPASTVSGKMKKQDGELLLKLVRTPDILLELGRRKRPGQKLVGFAAETHELRRYALDKLERKNLDWIAANDVGAPGLGFQSDFNAVTLYARGGGVTELPAASKELIAAQLLDLILT